MAEDVEQEQLRQLYVKTQSVRSFLDPFFKCVKIVSFIKLFFSTEEYFPIVNSLQKNAKLSEVSLNVKSLFAQKKLYSESSYTSVSMQVDFVGASVKCRMLND